MVSKIFVVIDQNVRWTWQEESRQRSKVDQLEDCQSRKTNHPSSVIGNSNNNSNTKQQQQQQCKQIPIYQGKLNIEPGRISTVGHGENLGRF